MGMSRQLGSSGQVRAFLDLGFFACQKQRTLDLQEDKVASQNIFIER